MHEAAMREICWAGGEGITRRVTQVRGCDDQPYDQVKHISDVRMQKRLGVSVVTAITTAT